MTEALHRLVAPSGDVEVVLDTSTGAPTIRYWGAPLGGSATLAALTALHDRPVTRGAADSVAPVSVVPEHALGFAGRPGLLGNRPGGRDWSPRFVPDGEPQLDGRRVVAHAVDHAAGLRLSCSFELSAALSVHVSVENIGDARYLLDGLTVTLPVPEHAAELLSLTGRWARELLPERTPWPHGASTFENRRGRTSHEHVPLVFAGSAGFGEWHGEVWGAHLAWSGNHVVHAERMSDGRRYLQLGELLHPGEVLLEPGQSYATPEVIAVHSAAGLTPASWGFHRHLRARTAHPASPRPVVLNTWEAVYFDHDLNRLRELATTAASLGVQRFVLDDGWFGSRRDDTSGLGDWVVSADVYPDGLAPLIDHVTGLGMEFGIWVEPEMVNPDSDVFRAHPEWALVDHRYEPVLARHQLVLDLANPAAFDHVFAQLDALLRDHDISYVKWDMNRDHVQGSGRDGSAGTHAQTSALYRLLDRLGAAHPEVEIESCSSGGARIDHGILQRTRRVWTSDCNDALDRQWIQRGASMFVPPEMMGAHVGPTRSHTTGRVHTLAFRVATAMFGHFGLEWDIASLDDRDRDRVRAAIDVHTRFRSLLHGGDTVRFDVDEPYLAHGVYTSDRSEALVSWALLGTPRSLTPPAWRLPGLDPDRTYRVRRVELPGDRRGPSRHEPTWPDHTLVGTGRELAAVGFCPPALDPESAAVFHLT
ncbi:alpha-galactosidase [soil metagenome]